LTITHAADARQQGSRVSCDHFPFTIGRAESADLSMPADRALSRTHVSIDRDEAGFVIQDLSSNGVYLNGRHIKGVTEPLVFGTTIVLSKETILTFVADLPVLPDLSGHVLNDRYILGDRIHQGMKGATYSARDNRLPRPLAVKVFAPALLQLEHYRSEFMRQAELAARLQHPSVCRVLDFGEAGIRELADLGPLSYLCLEYMEGGNLSGRLEAESLPPMDTILSWIERLAEALDHAHRNGVVHGDLKPACIVFDREERPYLTDFALGSSRDSEPAAAVLGTPAYMAPERWAGDHATEETDQYSLAVLAYLVVTGTRPHEGQSDPDVRQRNFRRGPPAAHEEALRSGRDDVSPALSAVLEKALSVDPAKRYPTVLEFGQAFARAIRNPGRRHSQPRIFISYQRESSAGWAVLFAHQLQTDHSFSVFVDTLAKDGAPTIPDRIRQEISECDVFVCFLAPKTLESSWVRQEITIAVQEGKPMVPIYHEDFRSSDEERHQDDTIRRLLSYDAVQLLDRRNIHVEYSITDLVHRIRKFVS
jgi:serine/threonine protein kinase